MFDDCIIMAGGSGTRLWPASNSRRPKQFLPVSPADPSRSFFSGALERALAVTAGSAATTAGPAGRVIIIAGKGHVSPIVSACARLDQRERDRLLLIVEPEAKNTAAAIACGARFAELVPVATATPATEAATADKSPRLVLVLTSDHIIEPLERFVEDAALAAILARQDRLVVFGIVPTRPETGYGYIEAGAPLAGEPTGARAAVSFREKPNRALAEEYLATGRFYWNSGMFAFSSSFMLDEFRRHAPRVLAPFEELALPGPARVDQGLRILDQWPGFAEAYARTQAISFDYAIAERCAAVALLSARFSWTDIGNWDEYARLLKNTGAEVYCAGAENCFVDSDIPVALCGVQDLIVSVRAGRDGPLVFIAKKGESQRVRELVEQIRAAGRTALL
ncbi:MAG: mannose-1-phosphate guanylyltransferase [Treponema sp.]|nr:mannose-1-phosphate guanylyltransferase [Treponema sp.]